MQAENPSSLFTSSSSTLSISSGRAAASHVDLRLELQLLLWGFDEETIRNTSLNKRNDMHVLPVAEDTELGLRDSLRPLRKVGSESESWSCTSSIVSSSSIDGYGVRFKPTVERVRYTPLRVVGVSGNPDQCIPPRPRRPVERDHRQRRSRGAAAAVVGTDGKISWTNGAAE